MGQSADKPGPGRARRLPGARSLLARFGAPGVPLRVFVIHPPSFRRGTATLEAADDNLSQRRKRTGRTASQSTHVGTILRGQLRVK